jgi:large subunit ribosomal protein L33
LRRAFARQDRPECRARGCPMAKLKRKETRVFLECKECKNRNYATKFKAKGGSKLDLKKFCPHCKKHTEHKSRRMD